MLSSLPSVSFSLFSLGKSSSCKAQLNFLCSIPSSLTSETLQASCFSPLDSLSPSSVTLTSHSPLSHSLLSSSAQDVCLSKVGTLSGLVVVPDSDLQTAGTQHITVEEMTGDARVASTLLLEFEDLGLVLAPCVDPRNSPTEGAF